MSSRAGAAYTWKSCRYCNFSLILSGLSFQGLARSRLPQQGLDFVDRTWQGVGIGEGKLRGCKEYAAKFYFVSTLGCPLQFPSEVTKDGVKRLGGEQV